MTQKRYFEQYVQKKILVLGIAGPPWSGLSVHTNRAMEALKISRNKVYFFDVRMRREFLFPFSYQLILWCRLLWWRPTVIVHYVCNQGGQDEFMVMRWAKRLLRFEYVIVEHNYPPLSLCGAEQKLVTIYPGVVDRWIFIGTNRSAFLSLAERPSVILYQQESEFIPPDKHKASVIMATYPLSVLTFMKIHNPLLIISMTDFKQYLEMNMYGIDHIIEVMSLLRLYYVHVGLIWGMADVSDLIKFSTLTQRIIHAGLDGNIYIFRNEQQVWPLFREAHLVWWPSSSYGFAIDEALLCNTPVVASAWCTNKEGVITYNPKDAHDCVQKMLPLLPRTGRKKQIRQAFEHREMVL